MILIGSAQLRADLLCEYAYISKPLLLVYVLGTDNVIHTCCFQCLAVVCSNRFTSLGQRSGTGHYIILGTLPTCMTFIGGTQM